MKKLLFFLSCALGVPFTILAQNNLSGTISNNMTLTAANSPYTVTDNVTVNSGVTLTVETGVELRFNSGKYIQVFGVLNANGATFTANASTTPGFWQGIYVAYEWNTPIGEVNLSNCQVEYAQSIFVRKGKLTLTGNTIISNFSSNGVDVYTEGNLIINNTTIQGCNFPLYFRGNNDYKNGSWTPGEGITLTGNTRDEIFLDFRDIRNTFELPELGVPYYFDSELQIMSAGTMLIHEGVTIWGNTGAYLNVNGKIKALGTETSPVIFTNYSGAAYWQGINVYDASIDTACIFTYCNFNGANYQYYDDRGSEIYRCAVEVNKSSPVFQNCEFSNNRYNLIVTGLSYPSFENCAFKPSNANFQQTVNINIDMNATPTFTNCSLEFNQNEGRAIGIIGSTVYGDAHFVQHSFNGIENITFTLYGQVVIHDTASMVIDAGIVIKCMRYDDYIQANGPLTAIGNESSPIIFTYFQDDNYGNPFDTYNNGTSSIGRSVSGRIILNSQQVSHLEYWKFIYGGYDSNNYSVYVYNNNILKNSEISQTYRGILFNGNAQLINNKLEYISYYPLARRMNAGLPVLINNTVNSVGNLGIYIHDFLAGDYSFGGLDIGDLTNAAYIIDTNEEIPVSANVTINAGTVIKFTNYYGNLRVSGGLKALGTAANKVIFTSIYDNSASGNTNYNGGNDPTGYKWSTFEFRESSNDSFNELNNCEVRYLQYGISITNCKVVIDSMLLNFCNSYALSIFGTANPVITNSEFNNIDNAPIHMDMFANPTFSGNSLANVSRVGISINGGTISGTIPARDFAGYDSITYIIEENLRVDGQLTIPAGLVFKGTGNNYIDIYGRLDVSGTQANPVIFTSLEDDGFGNPKDTEANGARTVNTNGVRLVYRESVDDNSLVNYAVFRYSYSYGIYNNNASTIIRNTKFYRTRDCGIILYGESFPTVEYCNFEDVPFPLMITPLSFPVNNQGNILSGTTGKGVLLINDQTLTQNTTFIKRSFAGIQNIPYVIDRFTVGTSAVLTIEPGVILKFRQNGYLNVRNGLIANGGSTSDSVIVFTSDRDDFYGGDTYGDGDSNLPTDRWWNGIYFPSESIDASCMLDNCVLKNASYYYTSGANTNNRGAVTIDNASPTIRNCVFDHNYWGIIVRNTSLPQITNNDFLTVGSPYGYAVWNETQIVTVDALNCWWNDATGPYHATLNPSGQGEKVSDGINFSPWISQSSQPIPGDVSMNGEVMPYDASLILQHTVGNITLTSKQLDVADVSNDGTVSSYDASLILQYSIGLITNFETGGKKSSQEYTGASVTVPFLNIRPENPGFELPVSLTTYSSTKALDIEIRIDPVHLEFSGVVTSNLPSGILLASGYNDQTGIIRLSLASAYDLNLNANELKFNFNIKDPSVGHSEISLAKLNANEKPQNGSAFTVLVENAAGETGIPEGSAFASLNIYSVDDMLRAEINLLAEQSKLFITVHDLSGRMMNQVVVENPRAGLNSVLFPANASGIRNVPKLYLVTIRGDNFVATRKLLH